MSMAPDPATLVRAGGSFLLAIVGFGALYLARGNKSGLALGALLASQGIYWTGQNLFKADAAAGVWWVPLAMPILALTVLSRLALFVWWPAPLRPHERRWAWAALAVGGLALAAFLAVFFTFLSGLPGGWEDVRAGVARDNVPAPHVAWTMIDLALSAMQGALLVALTILMPMRYLAARDDERELRLRLAWGGALLLLTPFSLGAWLVARHGFGGVGTGILASTMLAIAVPLWLVATRGPQGHLAARVAIVLAAAALVGLILASLGLDNPFEDVAVGVQRCLYAFLFAYGIARLGFLGHSIQLRTARRGTIAMGSLALLFIVAQVTQEFLAAQYGLLMGGVVAGAFLFAASPIQRLIERRGEPDAPRRLPMPSSENEDAYRSALRIALRDRVVSPEEEIHLADLGERLGIRAGRARELRHEIEAGSKGAR